MAEVQLKEINKLAIPAIFAGISEPLISLGDTAILGRLADSEIAVSGIAGATTFYLTIVWVLAQTKSATSAIISRALGANKLKGIESLVPQAIWFSILMGAILYIGTAPFSESIMHLFDLKGTALNYGSEYYQIRALGFPFVLAAFTIFGVFRGLQNTFWAMLISISGSLINLGLDLAFVHGIDGYVDAMGVRGAAYASLVSQLWMFIAAIIFLKWKTPFSLKPIRALNPHFKELLSIASNLFARTIILNFTIGLAVRTASGFSNAHNTAHTMGYQIWLFAAFFIDGYSNAANAIAGRLYGTGDFKALKQVMKKIMTYNVLIGCGLSVILGLFYYQVGHLLSNKEYVVQLFEGFFWIVLLVLPLNAIAFTLDGVFKGLGDAKLLRNVLFIATVFAFIPVLYTSTHFGLELRGIWIALTAWILVRSAIPWFKFKQLIDHKLKEDNR